MVKKRNQKKGRNQKTRPEPPDPAQGHSSTVFISRGQEILMMAFMAAVVFCIYANTLENPFVLDDLSNIAYNPNIRLTHPDIDELRKAGFESPLSNRPVAYLSFAFNYYLHQFDVAGYHILNIVIHAAAGIFLYFLIKTMLNSPALQNRSRTYNWIPFCTALIWLVHPIQTQSVTYVVQRMNSLAAMFYILAVLFYARARCAERNIAQWIILAGCVVSGILAMGSKEIAATLPVILFLYEWYFHQDLSLSWVRRQMLPIAGILALLAVVALLYLSLHPLNKILNAYAARDFTLMQRVLTEFRVVAYYISLLLWPHPARLNLDHSFIVSHSLWQPISTLPAILAIAGLFVAAVWLAEKHRLVSFCLLWYLINLLIESSVIGLEIIFEHRNYLPSMFLVLMVVVLLQRLLQLNWLRAGALGIATLMLCVWTIQRNAVWRSEVSLWTDCATKSSQKPRPQNNLGAALARQGDIDAAIVHYRRALQIKPDYAEAHFNLATALRRQGNLDEAEYHYREMLRLKPDHSGTHNLLGEVFHEQGKIDEAIVHYAEALRLNPEYSSAHYNMGVALMARRETDRAVFHFTEVLRLDPRHSGAHYQLATALNNAGKIQEAVSHFQAALSLKPDFAEAHHGLGTLRYKQGRVEEAAVHFFRALKLKPDFVQAHNDLGVLLYRRGQLQEAVAHYNRALSIRPNYAEAHNNIGAALDDLGRTEEAISHYREALRIAPDNARAHNNLGVALAIQGRFDAALKYFDEALRISPDDAEAHGNLANALASLGRYKEAIRQYHAALEINPADEEVRSNLEKALKQLDQQK